jgi:predicted DCC family thiol-disulfide oxidoreductase YuxK
MSARHVLLYDRDCGFCRWSVGWVLRLDRRRALEPLALQDPRAPGLLQELSEEERMRSAHVVTPEGHRFTGGAAAGPVVRVIPHASPLAVIAERFPGAAERVYRWIADHRDVFGRPVTEAAKRRADALIAERAGPG